MARLIDNSGETTTGLVVLTGAEELYAVYEVTPVEVIALRCLGWIDFAVPARHPQRLIYVSKYHPLEAWFGEKNC